MDDFPNPVILFPQRKPSEISSSLVAPGSSCLGPFPGGETDFPNAAPPLRVRPSRGHLSDLTGPRYLQWKMVGEEWDIHGWMIIWDIRWDTEKDENGMLMGELWDFFMDHTGINPWDIHDFPRNVDPHLWLPFFSCCKTEKTVQDYDGDYDLSCMI